MTGLCCNVGPETRQVARFHNVDEGMLKLCHLHTPCTHRIAHRRGPQRLATTMAPGATAPDIRQPSDTDIGVRRVSSAHKLNPADLSFDELVDAVEPQPREKDGWVLHPDLLSPRLLAAHYAVRGELYLKAEELKKKVRQVVTECAASHICHCCALCCSRLASL